MEIDKKTFEEMIKSRPNDLTVPEIVNELHAGGHTVQGLDIPGAASGVEGPGKLAWEAIKETTKEDIPLLGPMVGYLREKLPETIADKGMQLGMPTAGAALGAAVGTVGEMLPKTGGDLALQAAAGPALKVAGKLGKTAAKTGGELLSRATGVASPIIERAAMRPAFVKPSMIEKEVVEQEITKVKDALKAGLDNAGSKIGKIEDKFADYLGRQKQKVMIDVNPVRTKGIENTLKSGTSLPPKIVGPGGKIVGKVDSMPVGEVDMIRDHLAFFNKSKGQLSFGDALNKRREIGRQLDWRSSGLPPVSSKGERVLKMMYSDLNQELYKAAPGLRKANTAYTTARAAYERLGKTVFGFGTNISDATVQNRIRLALMRGHDSSILTKRAGQINASAEKAMNEVMDAVAALEFKPYVRKGMLGPIMTALGIGAAGYGAKVPLGSAIALGTLTSPRLGGYLAKGAGMAGQSAAPIAEGVTQALANPALQAGVRGAGQALKNESEK